jgi:hypothetical protein
MEQKRAVPKIALMILLGIIILPLFSGCNKENNEKTPENITEEAEATPNTSIDNNEMTKEKAEAIIFSEHFTDPEYYKELVKSAEKIQYELIREEVYSSQDETACEKIPNESGINDCKNTFYMSQSRNNNDKALCEKITDAYLKKSCISDVIIKLATKEEDISLCDEISEEANKKTCKNNVQFAIARKSKNKSSCENISDERLQKICIQEVAFSQKIKQKNQESTPAPTPTSEETPEVASE